MLSFKTTKIREVIADKYTGRIFSGKKELFKGLRIDELEKEWVKYPVFRIDFSGGKYKEPDGLQQKLEECLAAWE